MKMYDRPQAIGTRILVEVELDEEKAIKSDTIFIPDEAGSNNNQRVLNSATLGEVIQVGGAALETSIMTGTENEVCPGKVVLFLQNAGTTFNHSEEGKIYRILGLGDIMAIVGEA